MNIEEFSYFTPKEFGRADYERWCHMLGLPARVHGYGLLHCIDPDHESFHEGGDDNGGARVCLAIPDIEFFKMWLSAARDGGVERNIDGDVRPLVTWPEDFDGDFSFLRPKVTHAIIGWPDDWRDVIRVVGRGNAARAAEFDEDGGES